MERIETHGQFSSFGFASLTPKMGMRPSKGDRAATAGIGRGRGPAIARWGKAPVAGHKGDNAI